MLKLFEIGNAYVKQSDWKDLALVKACLFSMGILTALHKARKWARRVFIITYVPLMKKFFQVAKEQKK